jgi:hypothetical protein
MTSPSIREVVLLNPERLPDARRALHRNCVCKGSLVECAAVLAGKEARA